MSGIEVAGLVLGAFPLLVSGLENYSEGLQTIRHWWRYRRSSENLARILDAEYGRFQNICERLLDGLVSGALLDHLISHPQDPLWKTSDLKKKLKRRLGRDHRRYFRCVDAMENAIDDLWSRLELDKYGRPQWGSFYSFKHQYKRIRASLSHRKYEEALSKITKSNDLLACLMEQNVQAEPSRRRKRRPRLEFQSIQQQADSLYKCLDRECDCGYFHQTDLRLEARLGHENRHEMMKMRISYLTHGNDSSNSSRWFNFVIQALDLEEQTQKHQLSSRKDPTIFVESHETSSSKSKQSSQSSSSRQHRAPFGSKILSALNTKRDGKGRSKRSVKFTGIMDPEEDDNERPRHHRIESSSRKAYSNSTAKIDDLCCEAQRLALSMHEALLTSPKFVGAIGQKDSRRVQLGIYMTDVKAASSRSNDLKSLTGLLSGKYAKRRKDPLNLTLGHLTLGPGERLTIAVTIASSILQLYGTAWLDDFWDKSSIKLDMDQVGKGPHISSVYIRKSFPDEPMEQTKHTLIPFVIVNPIIYNLGVFLIEICLGRTLQSFRTDEDPLNKQGEADILTDLSTAMRLVDDIYSVAGTGYGDVVRRCIRCDFDSRCTDLSNETFRQAVYEKVVEPLEEDVKNFYKGA